MKTNATSRQRLLSRARFKLLHVIAAALFCAFTVPANVHAQVPQYKVTILGSLGGTNGSVANAINASGQVAGYSWTSGNASTDAVVWTGTTPTILGSVGGNSSNADGINASGQVAGVSNYAVVWTGTTPTILSPALGGTQYAAAINASGQVAGSCGGYAVVWTGTTPTILGSIGGQGRAKAINASGQVSGYSYTYTSGNDIQDAVVWTGTTPTILGSLGGNQSEGSAINDSGQVAGYSYTPGFASMDAVVWSGTTPTILGSLGGSSARANAINASGQVVGSSNTALTNSFHGFLYTSGTMYDLNDLIPPGTGVGIGFATGINDNGQIAAYGTYGGNTVALRLTPVVPIPSLTIQPVAGQTGQVKLVFGPLASGYTYTVQYNPDLSAGSWATLTGTTQSDNGNVRTVTDPNATGAKKFYRVQVSR